MGAGAEADRFVVGVGGVSGKRVIGAVEGMPFY